MNLIGRTITAGQAQPKLLPGILRGVHDWRIFDSTTMKVPNSLELQKQYLDDQLEGIERSLDGASLLPLTAAQSERLADATRVRAALFPAGTGFLKHVDYQQWVRMTAMVNALEGQETTAAVKRLGLTVEGLADAPVGAERAKFGSLALKWEASGATAGSRTLRREASGATAGSRTLRREASGATAGSRALRREASGATAGSRTLRREASGATAGSRTLRREASGATAGSRTLRREASGATADAEGDRRRSERLRRRDRHGFESPSWCGLASRSGWLTERS